MTAHVRHSSQLRAAGTQRYNWLGADQRASDSPAGIVLMGVRLYNPSTGRFLQTDPVYGGSANDYDYCNGDPVNCRDLDGRMGFWGHAKWTWLTIVAYTQLRLSRDLTTDLRRPWERPVTEPGRLTPARVRRGFRHLRAKLPVPAGAPKPTRPGPGRPPGSRNKHVTAHPPVGKTQHLNQTAITKPAKKV